MVSLQIEPSTQQYAVKLGDSKYQSERLVFDLPVVLFGRR